MPEHQNETPKTKQDGQRVVHPDGSVEYLSDPDEDELDSTLADSFPASDPPGHSPINHPGEPHRGA